MVWKVPQPRPCNARRLSHMERFSLIRVRSPLLTESLLFSLPAGTEMFHFPAFPPRTLCVQMRVTRQPHSPWRGFPIRTPWDHSPVIDSPRLIADSYVLLRLLMPRHPPCALKNLTTKDQKNTSRENHEKPATHNNHQPTRGRPSSHAARSRFIFLEIASHKRCSRPLCSSQTTTPNHTPHTHKRACDRCSQETRNKQTQETTSTTTAVPAPPGPVASGPNSVPNTKPPNPPPHRSQTGIRRQPVRTGHRRTTRQPLFVDIPPMSTRRRTNVCATGIYS